MKYFSLLMFGAILFTGCAGERWVRTRIQDNKDLSVFLEHSVRDDQIVKLGYAHPRDFSMTQLETVLRGLQYSEPGLFSRAEVLPVFSDPELLNLVPALTRAFARANEDQRIRFTTANKEGLVVFGSREYTEGVAFIEKGNLLNIAFAYIKKKPDHDEATSHNTTREYPNPLIVHSSSNPLIMRPGYRHRPSDYAGKPYPLWIMVELNMALAEAGDPQASPPEEPAPEQVPAAAEATKPPATTTPETKTPDQPVAIEPVKADPPATGPAEEAPPKEPEAVPDKTVIMVKLKLLKELFEEGLIDEEEYKAKKKECLEKL